MEDAFRFSDDFGPARIISIYQPSLALKAILVVDNTACGTAIGGVRMAPDVSVEECFRLARAMTWKNAAAGLPHGGSKSVIFGDPRMAAPVKEQLIRAFAPLPSVTSPIISLARTWERTNGAWPGSRKKLAGRSVYPA